MQRKRYKETEVLKEEYIQMPKWLFNDEFSKLSNDGKVLYSVLRDRHRLSLANKWVNENGEIYFLFSRENMADMLGCSIKSAIKYFKELLKFNLVEETRQGINKPNIIYLLDVTFENQLTGKIYNSRHVKSTSLDMYNLQCNKNDSINNDSSKNDYISYMAIKNSPNANYTSKEEFLNQLNRITDKSYKLVVNALSDFYTSFTTWNSGYNHYIIEDDKLAEYVNVIYDIFNHLGEYYTFSNNYGIIERYNKWYFSTNPRHNIKNFAKIKTFNLFLVTQLKDYVDQECYFEADGEIKDYFD